MGKALVLTGPRQISIQKYEEDQLQSKEVKVRTLYSGISAGTELTSYRGMNPHLKKVWNQELRIFEDEPDQEMDFPVKDWGYEEVGEVMEIGGGVQEIEKGDIIYGTWGHRSTWVLTEGEAVKHRLPETMDPICGIFSHIGSIALNAILDADIHVGETVAVFGQGVPGQIVTQLAKLNGAEVIAVDLNEKRLNFSREYGADTTLNPNECSPGRKIKEMTGGRGADVTIEMSGAIEALHEAIKATTYSGKTVASGFFPGNAEDLYLGEEFHHNRINLVCSQISGVKPEVSYRWDRLRMKHKIMELQNDEKLNLKELITHTFPLKDGEGAFKALDDGDEEFLQVVLNFDSGGN